MAIKKRVLVLTSTFPRWQGDSEPPFVFELCRRLKDKFDVLVLAPHADGTERFEKMDGVEVIRFRYFPPRWEKLAYQGGILANLKQSRWRFCLLPFFFAAQIMALLRILRCQRIDLIHAHWLVPQGLSVVMAGVVTRRIPPMVCTSHGGDLLGLNGWPLTSIKRWVIRRSSRFTVVSKAMTDFALSLGARPGQLHTISMGVNAQTLFMPDPAVVRADNELLFVGRLVEKKGIAVLLDAMPEIIRRQPGTCLRVVGSGPMGDALEQQVHRLGIAHAVTFTAALPNSDLPGLYRRATVFVGPSIITDQGDQEGLGLVLVEALACECPVVASDLPAIRDVVIHGETGLMVAQKNPAAVAGAVIRLLAEAGLRTQMARNGRQHVMRHFDWDGVAARYGRLFDELDGAARQ
ncbi:glycosyltransferase [Polaromonas sp. YR568]|uniref:glycosyltransferase n=1 Tax=Polaromonas sp. YR568 TaxID=1855301 RepID=UPI00398C1314